MNITDFTPAILPTARPARAARPQPASPVDTVQFGQGGPGAGLMDPRQMRAVVNNGHDVDMGRNLQARIEHLQRQVNDASTTPAQRLQLQRELAELRVRARTEAPAPRPQAPQRSPQAQEARRAAGLPQSLETHSGGPPAAPFAGRLERDAQGRVRTGTLLNEADLGGHRYVTVNALPPGLTEAEAVEAFRRFNAPTNEAQRGLGNEPTVGGVTRGYVDPSAPLGLPSRARTEPWRPFGFDATQTGGHVELRQGTGPDGRPWAVNTTIDGEHPLKGHVTRTLVQEDGRWYIRTEGVGDGNDGRFGARHMLNQVVGPATFNNLDALAAEWAEKQRRAANPGR